MGSSYGSTWFEIKMLLSYAVDLSASSAQEKQTIAVNA
jgi:hypothetical protein